jgi:hypothetical protein
VNTTGGKVAVGEHADVTLTRAHKVFVTAALAQNIFFSGNNLRNAPLFAGITKTAEAAPYSAQIV